MKIYTKTGDAGETGLYGGERRSKSDLRIRAYGTVDEFQAALGVAEAFMPQQSPLLIYTEAIQHDCFVICCELARTETKPKRNDPILNEERVTWLEQSIDELEASLPQLTAFIRQGGGQVGAQLFLARAICRRAEREVIGLHEKEPVSPVLLRYLNRLSDCLFVLARTANQADRVEEKTF